MAPSLAILMYHDIVETLEQGRDPAYDVLLRDFEEQMAYLDGAGFKVLSLRELAERRCTDPAPDRAVIVTFDDGRVSNFERALPALRRHGFPAEFFLTVGRIGKPGFVGWGQAAELMEAGMGVGSHAVRHVYLDDLPSQDARAELEDSKAELERRLGAPVGFFAPPGGRITPELTAFARRIGYRGICTSRVGVNRFGGDLFRLRRIAVVRDMSLERFKSIVHRRPGVIGRYRAAAGLRNAAKKLLGNRRYDWLREKILTRRHADL